MIALKKLFHVALLSGQKGESTSLASYLLRQFPHVLLIECMLEKICNTYESDPAKQKELFNGTYFSHSKAY